MISLWFRFVPPSCERGLNLTCNKVVKRLTIFCHIKSFLTRRARIQYYSVVVAPIMVYVCIIWGDATMYAIERIYKLQKYTTRLILDIKRPTNMNTED